MNGGDELRPRTRIDSVPYATLSNHALTLNGLTSEQLVLVEDLQAITDLTTTAQTAAEAAQTTANNAQGTADDNS